MEETPSNSSYNQNNLEITPQISQPKERKWVELTDMLKKLCLEYIDKKNYAEKTRILYSNQIENIFKKKTLTQQYYNSIFDKGYLYRSVLKLITATLEYNDLPTYKYKHIPQITKARKTPQVWSDNEMKQIISSLETDKDKLLVSCSYYIGAGIRFESAIYLKWSDFNWDDWLINQEKAGTCFIRAKRGKEATLPVDKQLMKQLYTYARVHRKFLYGKPFDFNNDQYMFIDKHELKEYIAAAKKQKWVKENLEMSEGVTKIKTEELGKVMLTKKLHDRFNYKLKVISKKSFNNKKIKFHSFRSSRATNLLKRGFSIVEIKDLLMHSTIQTTQIYLNLSNLDLQNKFNLIME